MKQELEAALERYLKNDEGFRWTFRVSHYRFDLIIKMIMMVLKYAGLEWKSIEDATTKRTDEGDCVTTEPMLVQNGFGKCCLIESDVMVNKNLLCIPISSILKLIE